MTRESGHLVIGYVPFLPFAGDRRVITPKGDSMPTSFSRFVFLSLAFSFLCGAFASAANVTGRVKDPDGRPVSNARVIVSGPLGIVSTVQSDSSGEFVINELAAGRYELRAVVEGFRSHIADVALTADERRDITIDLQISAISESVVVSASQVERPLSRTTDSVTVLTGTDLRIRQVDTLSDALRLAPGVTVARNGTRGALTSVFGRGGESNFMLVLVDGMRANDFGGGFSFEELPSAGIERVEIVRGPQSALFGSDALAGIVQVITRRDRPWTVEGRGDLGGLGTRQGSMAASGARAAWSWSGAAETIRSDGFTGIAPASGERVGNDDYSHRYLSAHTAWHDSQGLQLGGDVHVSRSERGFPGPYGSDPNHTFSGVDRIARGINDRLQVGAHALHFWPGAHPRVRQRTQVSWGDFNGSFAGQFPSITESQRLAARTQTDAVLARTASVSAGVEYQREHARSTYITGVDPSPLPIVRDVVGYFGELRIDAGTRTTASLGLRVEQIRRRALEGSTSAGRPRFGSDSEISPNPKVSVAWLARGEQNEATMGATRIHASAGTGIRPPDAFEIAFTDNPSLQPERSRSFEIGVSQNLIGGALSADATTFFNRYDHLIVAVGRSLRDASRYRTDNISNARARGLEISIAGRSAFGLDARVAYTFLDSQILADDGGIGDAPSPFKAGDALLRRPRHQVTVDLAVVRSRTNAYLRLNSRGGVLDVDPSFGSFGGLLMAPGFFAAGAGAAVHLTSHWEIYGHVTNLFDRKYEEALGFPASPRTLTIGVRIAAGH